MAASKTTDRAGQRWLSRLSRIAGPVTVWSLALPLAAGALLVVQAGLLARVLQSAIADGVPQAALVPSIGLLGGILCFRIALGVAGEAAAIRSSETIKRRLRGALLGDVLNRRPVWTAAKSSGALSALVVEQVDAVDGYFARYLPAIVQASILPLAFAAVCFPADWVVGMLFLVTAPLIPVFMALAGWGAEAATRSQASALARLSGRFADRLRGLVTLKLFGRAEAETEGIRTASEELRTRTMRVMRIAFLSSAVLEFFAALGVAGVALYVGLTFLDLVSLRSSTLTLEAGLFCLLMAPEVYQPLRLLAANYHDRAAAKAAASEIAGQLGALPEVDREEAENAATLVDAPMRPLPVMLAGVAVESPSGRPVVEDVQLAVAAGAHVALLGPSGCGKSTLLEAIAGLREAKGAILLDGQALASIDEPRLRAGVAFLGQRPRIFAGTIAENIRFGRPDACDTAVALAARRACVDLFADGLPLGLATPLGENGLGLSGGEIQRIALARIYLRDPGLVLMDEPTAHLDAVTESAVIDGIVAFARGRTLIVATHSQAVAARMERVYRIAGRRVLPAPRPSAPGQAVRREAAA